MNYIVLHKPSGKVFGTFGPHNGAAERFALNMALKNEEPQENYIPLPINIAKVETATKEIYGEQD